MSIDRSFPSIAARRGIAGIVIDGAIRDSATFREDNFPCYARGVTHRGPFKDGPGEINVQVSIDGDVVNPGDIVVGDDDGVLFISPAHADALAAASRKKLADETATLAAIANGTHNDAWIDQILRAKGVLPQ